MNLIINFTIEVNGSRHKKCGVTSHLSTGQNLREKYREK